MVSPANITFARVAPIPPVVDSGVATSPEILVNRAARGADPTISLQRRSRMTHGGAMIAETGGIVRDRRAAVAGLISRPVAAPIAVHTVRGMLSLTLPISALRPCGLRDFGAGEAAPTRQ
ncbi:hypothetical protein [Microbacterium aurum]